MSAMQDGMVLGPSEGMLAASVARRFHLQGRSKVEIAEEFGISRFKVARLLDAARAAGLVRVEVAALGGCDLELSDDLRRAYGLHTALVVGTECESTLDLRHALARTAAELLTETVRPGDVLGLAWGRTVNVMAYALTRLPRCPVVQLCGVYSLTEARDRSVETVRKVAAVSGGAAYPIYAPLVCPDRRTTETLRAQRGISEVFERFASVTKAVVAIGAWQPDLSTVYDVLEES
jgi:DNA-binding transcriptional regulator LsrR (DeoR family)